MKDRKRMRTMKKKQVRKGKRGKATKGVGRCGDQGSYIRRKGKSEG